MHERQVDPLIAEYIEPHPVAGGGAEARVKGRAAPVWALIARYKLTPGENAAEQVAKAYRITPEAMRAALAYYRSHAAEIDARIAGHDAA